MPYLIGTDEAGYAPNLGPLVVSASTFWVDDLAAAGDLYRRLNRVVSRRPPRGATTRRLAIADSKALYSPAVGLRWLERGVLAALGTVNRAVAGWLDVWRALDPGALARTPAMPWHVGYDERLPVAADTEDLARLVPRLVRGMDEAGVRLSGLDSRAVFPDEFNRANDRWGKKSETLSKITLGLVKQALARCDGEPVLVICDKHGARNAYGRLLQEQFPDPFVEVREEGNARSVYRWRSAGAQVEVRFCAGGEIFLPVALASMTSKYLRELSMRAFNQYWCTRVANLAPTAGYPTDARRFRTAVRKAQTALGIADQIMWRSR